MQLKNGGLMYFFTADEHYGHANIIRYCNRPFTSVDEMDEALMANFNSVVKDNDLTIHAGDFCWAKTQADAYKKYISKLNGGHVFLKGSHDRWLNNSAHEIWEERIDGQYVVVCHYALRTWARSHYNSWHLYGHTHGKLLPIGKSWDIGVDNNGYLPLSFDQVVEIMQNRSDNINYCGE